MSVSKPTEMTIRDLLQEELRKRGILDYLYPALANEIQQPINTHARITIVVTNY